jgi:hypothetical protein
MRTTTKRRARRLALVTVAAPVAAWALEHAARRAEAGNTTSSTSRRLRQGADFVQRFGRGPLADRLRQRPVTNVTWRQQPRNPTSIVDSRRPTAPAPGSRLRLLPRPTGGTRPQSGAPAPSAHLERSLALMTGLRDGRMVSRLR